MHLTELNSDGAVKRNTVLVILFLGLAVGAIWRFTPLHENLTPSSLLQWGQKIQGHPWTPFGVLAVYIISGLLFFFHAAVLWVTVFTFDTLHAAFYCVVGTLASASTLYGLGRVLRQDVVRRLAGSKANKVSQALGHNAIVSLIILHIFPICPFSVLNLLAGATHVRYRDFIAGTFLGMVPGITLLVIFGNQILKRIQHPTWPLVLGLVLFVALGAMVLARMRKRLLPTVLAGES